MKLRSTVVVFLFFLALLLLPPPASAQSTAWTSQCYYQDGADQIATLQGIQCIVLNLLQVAIRLIGVAAFIMILISGVKMIFSGGEPKALSAAQQTLTLAMGGLVLAVLSWFILNLIEQFTGAHVTQFEFPIF